MTSKTSLRSKGQNLNSQRQTLMIFCPAEAWPPKYKHLITTLMRTFTTMRRHPTKLLLTPKRIRGQHKSQEIYLSWVQLSSTKWSRQTYLGRSLNKSKINPIFIKGRIWVLQGPWYQFTQTVRVNIKPKLCKGKLPTHIKLDSFPWTVSMQRITNWSSKLKERKRQLEQCSPTRSTLFLRVCQSVSHFTLVKIRLNLSKFNRIY